MPAGSQAVDQVARQSQALGLCARGSRITDQGAHSPEVSGVSAQATDWGMHPPRSFGPVRPGSWVADQHVCPLWVSGVGAQAADLDVYQPGFRGVLGMLIRCSQSRG